MPIYGLKYQTQFTSQSDPNNASLNYTLQFLFKDYTGEVATLIGAETTVIQRCTVDDPVALVKGQSLDISIINKGNVPITSFQSEDDDGVQVKLLQGANLLFIGFLVQDDFYELKVDFAHTITLSANDSLGLLKGVVLSEAEVTNTYSVVMLGVPGPSNLDVFYLSVADASFNPVVGGTLEILGVTYTIESAQPITIVFGSVLYNWIIRVNPDTPGWTVAITENVIVTGPLNLLNRNKLSDIIYACLRQTNLSLLTNIYYNLYESHQDPLRSTLEQTLIDSQTFISGDTYDNCYTVLEKIFRAFNLTLFQANGQWNIIHVLEAKRYPNNAIPGFVYDEQFKFLGNTVFNNNFLIGPEPQITRPITGLTEGALRGFKFTKRTFDYKQPKYLLQNYDLQTLGPLLRQYIDGTTTVYEYTAVGWEQAFGTPAAERFIRIVKDTASNTETDRALVIRGPVFDNPRAVQGMPFEVSQGDKIKFSFSFQTNYSYGGPSSVVFAVRLTDGTLNRYVSDEPENNGEWTSSVGFVYQILGGDNFNQLHTVEIQSSRAPFSGLVYCYLPDLDPNPGTTSRETYIRDIRLEYQPYIADQVKIIGQEHSQTQDVNKKLFSEQEIFIDDSPRNGIEGTLFLNTKTNSITQDRTLYWRYPTDGNAWRLGELATLDDLTWRARTRSKFEGGFIGNYQNGLPVSLLSWFITDFYPTKNYAPGLMTIDYKRNQFSCTLWEIYDLNDAVLVAAYLLKYLYSTT